MLREPLGYFHIDDRKHVGCIRLERTELNKKYKAKCWPKMIAYAIQFRTLGIPFIMQGRLMDSKGKVIGKPDLTTLVDMTCYEFALSETQKRFDEKNYFPFKKLLIRV